jgi:two-component system CheB/CheR fusion protein
MHQWPQSLKTTVDLMLASGHAMQLALGPERTILYNDAYAPMLGERHPDALGMPFREAWPDIWKDIEPLVERVFAGETVRFEDMPLLMTRHGYAEQTWWNFSYSPVRDESDAIAGLLNVTVDVTAKHRTEQAERERDEASARLRQNEARFRALVTAGANSVYRMSPDWRLMYQLDSRTLINTTAPIDDWAEKYILDEDLPEVRSAIAEAMRTRSLFELEHRVHLSDGSVGWVLSRAVPLFGPDGEITEWFGVVRDVSDRKAVQAALRESEALLTGQKDAFEAAVDGRPLVEALGILRDTAVKHAGEGGQCGFYLANHETKQLWHVVGMSDEFRECGDGVPIGADQPGCGLAVHTGEPVVTPDALTSERWQPWRWLAEKFHFRGVWSFPLKATGGHVVGSFAMYFKEVRDAKPRDYAFASVIAEAAAIIISRHQHAQERERAEASLRDSKEQLQLALVAARMGTWQWEVSSDHHRRDSNLNRLLGLEAADTVRPVEEFFNHIHPDDRARVRAAFDASVRHGHNMQVDFRVILPDGEVRWLSDKGDVFGSGADRYLAGACVDITERKKLEDELREADRRKDEFLAMLGHELRNPLAPLSNASTILRRPNLDRATIERAHAMMERQVGHLSRLVNDLLDVSRISVGVIELKRAPVDLCEVADQAVEMAMPELERQGHELTLTLSCKPLMVDGDAARLTQVIFNLLNNAAKYTPTGGYVSLTLERDYDQVVVRVRDNGFGMTRELVPRVFEMFSQGTRTLDRSQGGLGLGLTLVKRLVEMHGGTVAASSAGLGLGSEFWVRLPALPAQFQPPVQAETPEPEPTPSAETALVIDDVADIADSCAWLFEGLISEVRVAYSGAQALEIARIRPPGLILCDLGMPGMDGYETCRRLRQLPGLERTIVAAVSGYGGDEYVRASKEAGFDRHLVKPISRAMLEGLVQSLANRMISHS